MSSTSTLSKKISSPVPRRVKPGSAVFTETHQITRVGGSPSEESRVVSIELDKLHRHPKNRVIDPASLDDLVQSLQEHGQREPIRVRPLADPIGHYELISGERRYLSALRCEPPIDALLAIVESSGDAATLIDLAVANAAREDLDPIQRAELMIELIMPVEQGGAGMAKAAAGRVFGLNSESGVKNALRLLNLPQFFRDLLQAKQVAISNVRPLCAYPSDLLEQFALWLQDSKETHRLESFTHPTRDDDESIDEEIIDFIDRETRTCDSVTQSFGYQVGSWPCLFKLDALTDKQREQLQIHEVPHRDRWNKTPAGATRLVAMNVKAWHKLQDPLIDKAKADKQSKQSKSAKGKAAASPTGEPAAKPTAAELKARRKKADEQLEHYTRDWICRALRYQCSDIQSWTEDTAAVVSLVPWLVAASYETSHLGKWNDWAFAESLLLREQTKSKGRGELSAATFRNLSGLSDYVRFYSALWRVILWPSGTSSNPHPDLAPPGSIPEQMPGFSTQDIHELAEACGVSIETVWTTATKDSMQRSLVRQWLTRHNKEQLSDLAKSLGVAIADGKRDEIVTELLGHHQHSPQKKPLKLPAMISKLISKKGRSS